MADVKSFNIERKRWYRGRGGDGSALLRDDGQMCCLGFYALARGLTPDQIENVADPSEVAGDGLTRWPAWMMEDLDRRVQSAYTEALIDVNDDPGLNERERESAIRKMFASNGVRVRFTE